MTKKSKKQKIRSDRRKQRAGEYPNPTLPAQKSTPEQESILIHHQIPQYTIPLVSTAQKSTHSHALTTSSTSLPYELRKIVFLSLVAFSLEGIVYWALTK